ncbi:predicted protein [Sclerotinia sclerotiorum 1980 UF-70]|uniref:Uncharacterized protein n=1 Tax=Sclerotinia sclerotiorum (strain ATCC 18683 / 1980 / Ss-1) TaxID=665079 RepID=A7E879_SCLS1|nr:predicted protein [Sclerotinia sclerotiorum 1980 UF-70]EDN96581.1 predicted protein [Sclerotinia sclerotiorum 1980 UF-70]
MAEDARGFSNIRDDFFLPMRLTSSPPTFTNTFIEQKHPTRCSLNAISTTQAPNRTSFISKPSLDDNHPPLSSNPLVAHLYKLRNGGKQLTPASETRVQKFSLYHATPENGKSYTSETVMLHRSSFSSSGKPN